MTWSGIGRTPHLSLWWRSSRRCDRPSAVPGVVRSPIRDPSDRISASTADPILGDRPGCGPSICRGVAAPSRQGDILDSTARRVCCRDILVPDGPSSGHVTASRPMARVRSGHRVDRDPRCWALRLFSDPAVLLIPCRATKMDVFKTMQQQQ